MRSKKLWFFVAIAGVVVIAIIPGSMELFRQKKAASQALESYTQSLVKQDYRGAYNLTDDAFKASLTYDDFVALQKALTTEFGSLRSVKQGQTEVEVKEKVWSGLIHVRFQYAQNEITMLVSLRRDGGEWKIFGYKQL
jgi:hypothetical protein